MLGLWPASPDGVGYPAAECVGVDTESTVSLRAISKRESHPQYRWKNSLGVAFTTLDLSAQR